MTARAIGSSNRLTQNGTTTTTIYVGNLEEVATSGSTTTKTTYYYAGSARIAEAVNGTFSYLASDGLGSATVALNASGGVTASVLYAPYGSVRYSNGTMPTDYGFTGQHADSATGLDYFNARYYDPVAGQFTSADTVLPQNGYDLWGLSRYAYVEGNPITRTDPSGHCWPWCTAAIGFFIGATINYGSQVVGNLQHHQSLGAALTHVNVGEIAKSGMIGAIAGVGGPETLAGGLAARAAIAGVTGGGAQVADNLLHGRHWSEGVGQSAILSAATFGLSHGGSVGIRALARNWARAAVRDSESSIGGRFWTRDEFRGTRVYQRDDLIDPGRQDRLGESSLSRMRRGAAPIGPDKRTIILHHMLQTNDGPISELSYTFNRRWFGVIHINPPSFGSGIDRGAFDDWRAAYWMARAARIEQRLARLQ